MRYFCIFLCLATVLGAVIFAVKRWNDTKFETDKALSAMQLKADYLERVSWIRSMPDEVQTQSGQGELKRFFQWYFKQMNAHVTAFNLNPEFDDYLKEVTSDNIEKSTEKRKVYEHVRSVFDAMRHGSYHPEWSASSQGVRLDVLSTKLVVDDKGETKIRYQLVIWGLPRIQTKDAQKRLRVHNLASFYAEWSMFDAKKKRIAKMNFEGGLAGRNDWPERYVSMFPADVTLGYYEVDLMPFEAETVEIKFSILSASLTDGSMSPTFVWKRAIPYDWRLKSGEEWKGAVPVEGLSLLSQ